jgi:predicted negative regulator of RcsB-dependent stress response
MDTIALAHLADLQLRRGRLEEAAGALDRAEAAAGTTRLTAGLRGDLLFRKQRWQDAGRAYQDAVAPRRARDTPVAAAGSLPVPAGRP